MPPDRLGDYLRGFDALLRESGLDGVPYGHFGDGCVHVRIDFPLRERDGARRFRAFVEAAADLTAGHGGSMSGEHGDGRARSALLSRMYSAEALDAVRRRQAPLRPRRPAQPRCARRATTRRGRPAADRAAARAAPRAPARARRRLGRRGGAPLHRRRQVPRRQHRRGGVMCPSYVATRDEKDSTRGRARVLQEMVNGGLVSDGWRSDEVHEALDLCLSCKGCASDCPTGIDMATYKAEALHQRYRRRLRPRSHYALGQLPRWARLAQPAAPLLNRLMGSGAVQRVAKAAAGVDARRACPPSNPTRCAAPRAAPRAQRHRRRRMRTTSWCGPTRSPTVSLPTPAAPRSRCWSGPDCAWAWSASRPAAASPGSAPASSRRAGGSCGARSTSSTRTSSGVSRSSAWSRRAWPPCARTPWSSPTTHGRPRSPPASARSPRCCPASTAGRLPTSAAPPSSSSRTATTPASSAGRPTPTCSPARAPAVTRVGGCCGLAGNFGVEKGHYEVSVAVAEHDLLPAVRAAGDDAVVLADGFSCRTQLADLVDVRAIHLAELLARARESGEYRRRPGVTCFDRVGASR